MAAHSAAAQNLTNDGSTITLASGAVLYVSGGVTNKAGSTLDLGTGGQLQVGGDFLNAGIIVPGTGAVVLSGTAAQILDLGGAAPVGAGPTAATLYDLTLNNAMAGTAVNVPSNLAIGHQLTFANTSGQLLTAPTATVTLISGATVSNETKLHYVMGNLRAERAAVSGIIALDFGNQALLNPNGNNLGNVALIRSAGLQTANVSYGVNPAPMSTLKGIDQIWKVVPATQPAAGNPVTMQLTWFDVNDNGVTGLNRSKVWRRTSAMTNTWLPAGPFVDASASRTISAPVEGPLFQMTVSTETSPLPVTLVAFSAVRRGEAALLQWRTASEKNNDYFGVEASTDGKSFRQFARVAGHGNSSALLDYELTDAALLSYRAPVVYYRLRQVDFDGTATYSPVATVLVETTGFVATAAPNPLGSEGTRISVRTGVAGPAELTVYDGVGRLLLGRRTELLPGTNEVALGEAGELATGVYLLKVTQGKQRTMLKLVRE